ncbi:MAG: SurA N-terminal domain-containing protein [Akkermansia sp.]
MNILEFIRKNSILVIIVIAGVGAGLLMMDYGNKGSSITGDFLIQVDGTNYSDQEAYALGGNGEAYLRQLISSAPKKLRDRFDADHNEQLSDEEMANLQAYIQENPSIQDSMNNLESTYQAWSYGQLKEETVNMAVNRAIIQAEGKKLGIYPSKEQIDRYIESLPAFTNADGSFDQKLYRSMSGYRGDLADNAAEKAFRSVVADIIVWESLQKLLTKGMAPQAQTESALIDASMQDMYGKTAWLDASLIESPAPTEEESKAYWEENKERYLSEEQRIVSLYTLTPSADSNIDELMTTAELLMQDIAQSNGTGIDELLATAAENPENAPFTYLTAEGKSHITLPASTKANAAPELQQEIEGKDGLIPLSDVAFTVDGAPSMESYQKAADQGKALPQTSIKQIRGFYPTQTGTLVMMIVNATEAPTVLPYEQAKAAADLDFIADKKLERLSQKANELQEQMQAALDKSGLDAAFQLATEAKADVADFGPVALEANTDLPQGLDPSALMSVASNSLAPIVITNDGARITAVTSRTVMDGPEIAAFKSMQMLPMAQQKLRQQILIDWLHMSYQKFDVKLAERLSQNN